MVTQPINAALTGATSLLEKYPGLDDTTKQLVVSGKKTYKDALSEKIAKEKADKEEAAGNAFLHNAITTGDKRGVAQYDFVQAKKNIIKLRREQAKTQGIDDSKRTDDQVYNGLVKKLGTGGIDKMLNGDLSFFKQGEKQGTVSDITIKKPEVGPGAVAALGGAALGASYAIPKALEIGGKIVYNSALKAGANAESFEREGAAIADYKAGLGPKPKKIVDTALEQPGVWGTPTGISADVKKNMINIWDKQVAPVMKKITDSGWKMTIGKLETAVGKKIDELKKIKDVQGYADDLKAGVSEYFGERMDKGVSSWTMEQLQGEKVALRNFLQKKVLAGGIPADADKLVDKVVADTFSDIIHTKLQAAGPEGVAASKAFTERGNQAALKDFSKLYGKSPLKGGGMGVIQTLQESVGVPIATAGGKLLNKIGKFTNIPEQIAKGGKAILEGLVKGGKLFTMLEDGSLIPGSPTNRVMESLLADEKDYITITNGPLKGYSVPKSAQKIVNGKKMIETDVGYVNESGKVYQ